MPDQPRLPLGKRIRRQRRFVGLTQQQLADILGLDQTAVAKWEACRSEPHIKIRQRLAAALGMNYFALFIEEDEAA